MKSKNIQPPPQVNNARAGSRGRQRDASLIVRAAGYLPSVSKKQRNKFAEVYEPRRSYRERLWEMANFIVLLDSVAPVGN